MLLILGISIFLLVINRKPAPVVIDGVNRTPSNNTVPPTPGATATVIPTGAKVQPLTATETEENTVKKMATIFVERYNSYSSDAAFQNIRDVETLVTPAYWKKLSPLLKNTTPAASYTAATTEVVVAEVSPLVNSAATVTIKARRESIEKGVSTTAYQTIRVSMQKQGAAWLVDSQTISK